MGGQNAGHHPNLADRINDRGTKTPESKGNVSKPPWIVYKFLFTLVFEKHNIWYEEWLHLIKFGTFTGIHNFILDF